jgi:hypothetical protein
MKTSKIAKVLTSIVLIVLTILIIRTIYLLIVPSANQGFNILSVLLMAPYIFSAALVFSIIAVYRNKKQKIWWVILVITVILLVLSIVLLKTFLSLPFGAGTN